MGECPFRKRKKNVRKIKREETRGAPQWNEGNQLPDCKRMQTIRRQGLTVCKGRLASKS